MSHDKILLTQKEAAALLGISVNTFKARVKPHVGFVSIGTLRYPLSEIEKWVRYNTQNYA